MSANPLCRRIAFRSVLQRRASERRLVTIVIITVRRALPHQRESDDTHEYILKIYLITSVDGHADTRTDRKTKDGGHPGKESSAVIVCWKPAARPTRDSQHALLFRSRADLTWGTSHHCSLSFQYHTEVHIAHKTYTISHQTHIPCHAQQTCFRSIDRSYRPVALLTARIDPQVGGGPELRFTLVIST